MKRIICVLLACALLIVPAVRPARATGAGATVGIIGGTIGTGGAAGGIAAGSVLLPVLGVVGAVLAAYGINVALTDASQQAGLTKTQFIYSKIGEFADFAGLNVDAVIQGISQNVKVSPTGNIVLDAVGGAVVSQFIDWLYNGGSVAESAGGVSPSEYLALLPTSVTTSNPVYTRNFSAEGSAPVYLCLCSRNITTPGALANVYCLSLSPFNWTVSRSDGRTSNGTASSTTNTNGLVVYTAYIFQYNNQYLQSAPCTVFPGDVGTLRNSLNAADFEVTQADDVFVGDRHEWDENKDLLKPGADDTISINPDLLNPVIENAAAGDYTATVPDYLTALANVLDRADAGEVSLPVTNVATGAAVPLAVPSTAAAAPAITNVAATSPDVVGAGALADPAIPISPADAAPGLQFDLTEIFPFCIPFDLVDMVTLLSADPVTPRFHLAWTFPIINAPVEFDVDLSQFDGIAAIVRPFELLIFVIGLALVTRDLIRG